MINHYQNKVDSFSKSLYKINNVSMLLKELKVFMVDFQDSEYHNNILVEITNNYSELSKYGIKRFKRNLIIQLYSYNDFKWYHNHSVFTDDMLFNGKLDVFALNKLKENYQILFQYSQMKNGHFSRYLNALRRRLDMINNKASANTIGMRSPHLRLELLSLLNEINETISSRYGHSVNIQVNSLIRTIEHQKQLIKIGYTFSLFSAHCVGFAVDIERKWYIMNNRPLFKIINNCLETYAEKGIINLINEGVVWHICLNPDYIETYKKKLETYIN